MITIARRLSFVGVLVASLPAAAQPLPTATTSAPGDVAAAEGARSTSLEAYMGSLFTPQRGLTADQVASRAGATSFDVRARHAELEAAAAAVDTALIAYFPKLTLVGRYARLSHFEDQVIGNVVAAPTTPLGPVPPGAPLVNVPISFSSIMNQTLFQATLNVPLSDYLLRISQSYAAASHSERAAELNEQAAKLKAALDGRTVYYSWARARLQAFVARRALEQANTHLVDVKHVYESGAGSKADVLRVEAQVANTELLVQRADSLGRVMEQTLRTAMHDSAPREYALGEDLGATLPAMGEKSDPDALYAEALRYRLEVRALNETLGSFKEQAKAVRAGYFPRLDAFGDVSYANPTLRIFPPKEEFRASWSAGLQITWIVNEIGTSAAQGRSLDARGALIEAQKGALADALRMEVVQTHRALLDAEFAIKTAARALSAAEESYRVRRELFQNGRATSTELTDAETELTRAELEVINARVDLRIARARLLHASGRDAAPAAP